MTSYTRNDYYFNEIDALSCNNRPISSTLRSKSACNTYESQTEDETTSYDLYGNQEYNDGSSCDSYNHQQRSTSTMSNGGNYNVTYYSHDYNQYCENVTTTDNLMYHRDACSGDSSERYEIYTTLDYGDYDNLGSGCVNYETTTAAADGQALPFLAYSMWDGMYASSQQRQNNVSLPSTPTFFYNDVGAGGKGMDSSNGDCGRGNLIAHGVKAQLLNGQRHSTAFYGPNKQPERIVPLSQSQLLYEKQSLKQHFFEDNYDNMATTTTSMSAYRNKMNVDYKNDLTDSGPNQTVSHHNLYYDNNSPEPNSRESDYNNSYNIYKSHNFVDPPRPHTAMSSMEEYNDFGLNSMNNMASYSDTSVTTAAKPYANQQKLQDMQKCRYSIIMAMTTASVIASGETRIPQHLLKKNQKTTASFKADTTTIASGALKASTGADMDSIAGSYGDNSGSFVDLASCNNKNNSISGSNNIMSCAYTNVTMIPNHSIATFPPVTLSTSAAASMQMLSSASPIAADREGSTNITQSSATETPTGISLLKNLTSRKLPKHHSGLGVVVNKQLPQSPQYPLSQAVSNKTLPLIPQTLSLKANDKLDNIKTTSSILSTATTTSSSTSSTFSLSYQGISSTSSSFKTSPTKTFATSNLAPSTHTTAANLLPNNNNNNTNIENSDKFNNYKNNNNFSNNNNVQNTEDKEAEGNIVESLKDKEEATDHLSTMPSRLNSLNTMQASHLQLKTGTAYDSLKISNSTSSLSTTPPIAVASTSELPTITSSSSSKLPTSESISILDSDYNITCNYADYLKTYTLPSFSTSNSTQSNHISSISSSYLSYPSLDKHTDYLTFTSTTSIDTSNMLTTTITSSSSTLTSTSANPIETLATSTISKLALNNRGLNNVITALNLSDNNISRTKNSISSPVTKIASPSGINVPITSITSCITATSNIQTSIECSLPNSLDSTYLDHISVNKSSPIEQKHNENDKKSEFSLENNITEKFAFNSSYIDDYDSYLQDYKLDSRSLSTTTHTLVTTTTITTPSSSTTLSSSIHPTSISCTSTNTLDTISLSNSTLEEKKHKEIKQITDFSLDTNTKTKEVGFSSPCKTSSAISSPSLSNLQSSIVTNTLATTYLDNTPLSTSTPIEQKHKYIQKESELSFDTNAKTKESSISSSYINDYDSYLQDYKLDSISSSNTTHTLGTTISITTSSSTMNNSWPTNTMSLTVTTIQANDNICYTTNNNKIESSFASALSNSLFTTTDTTAAESTPTSTKDSLTTSAATSSPTQNADYFKDLSLKTLSSSTFFVTEKSNQPTQPAYIMDFLLTSKSQESESQNYLNLYKINEEDIMTDINFSKTINNNNTTSSTKQTLVKDMDIKPQVTLDLDVPTTAESITTASVISTIADTKTTIDNQPTANTALTMVDFDDNFYSSFSVNLNSLMADPTTTADDSNTTAYVTKKYGMTESMTTNELQTASKITCVDTLSGSQKYLNAVNTSKSMFDISNSNRTIVGSSNDNETPAITVAKTSAAVISTMQSSVSTNATTQKQTTGLKAASMLGDLSQSLKGGLDGVLAATGSNDRPQQKRGFGFGLASKLVPNVGSLLGSTSKSTPSTQAPKTLTTQSFPNQSPQITQSFNTLDDYRVDPVITSNGTETSLNDKYYNNVNSNENIDYGITSTHTTSEIYGENGNGSGLYYNNSETTYYHMTSSVDYIQDEITNHADEMMMYDDAVTGEMFEGVASKEYFSNDNQAIDMYGGYSEYETLTTINNFVNDNSMVYTTTSGTAISTAIGPTTQVTVSNDSNSMSAKKATSTLFSSLTNVASQISQQNSAATMATTCSSTPTVTSTKSSSGGMFGSIFGKAAAAMQTATQVVNQGASMATTKVQKNLQSSTAVSLIKRVPTTEELPHPPNTICPPAADTVTVTDLSYQSNALATQRDSLASPYASSLGGSGDDYDNSNIPNTDKEFDPTNLDDTEEYYYANQSQQQQIHPQCQQKLLPTVPPAGGSTGKKLPTINDKSGCLVKQQPTEMYEEDNDVLDNKSQAYLKRLPTYDIDSEQADYYMDTQPVAPSARHVTANGYYEHTNGDGSYDYRHDYFNEEDEFKYLEKEEIQAKENVYTMHQQQQLRQMHTQSSLQYVVDDEYQHGQNDIMDDYMDEMYHSEDSGNYLDESSSGSVKGIGTHQQQQVAPTTTVTSINDTHHIKSTTTTSPSVIAAPFNQQIKKQDSIILEEDEKDELSSMVGLADTVASPSKSLSRKSSHDILDVEGDQMSDLQMVSSSLRSSQSRKMKLMRGETEEVVGGHIQIMKRKTEVTAKQRWHWAYNKIIMQLNNKIPKM